MLELIIVALIALGILCAISGIGYWMANAKIFDRFFRWIEKRIML